jgi:hypothetical protein
MPATSKSLFTSKVSHCKDSRSLIDPIEYAVTGVTQASSDIISSTFANILSLIETLYSSNAANKTYENIPNSYTQYATLLTSVQDEIATNTNEEIAVLLRIAEDTLQASINLYTLYGENVLLQVDKSTLETQVQDLINAVNVEEVSTSTNTSSLTLTQTFKLANVFNYYIMIYGMPVTGEGFNPVKVAYLVDILSANGIDPYA